MFFGNFGRESLVWRGGGGFMLRDDNRHCVCDGGRSKIPASGSVKCDNTCVEKSVTKEVRLRGRREGISNEREAKKEGEKRGRSKARPSWSVAVMKG